MYNNIVIYIVGLPPDQSGDNSEMHIFQVNLIVVIMIHSR